MARAWGLEKPDSLLGTSPTLGAKEVGPKSAQAMASVFSLETGLSIQVGDTLGGLTAPPANHVSTARLRLVGGLGPRRTSARGPWAFVVLSQPIRGGIVRPIMDTAIKPRHEFGNGRGDPASAFVVCTHNSDRGVQCRPGLGLLVRVTIASTLPGEEFPLPDVFM